ncbi:MAG: hypothetical protein LC808_17415 [Actinobacteria bacterium]|nr:hypothetical protein [Actinomycetota bacterium]
MTNQDERSRLPDFAQRNSPSELSTAGPNPVHHAIMQQRPHTRASRTHARCTRCPCRSPIWTSWAASTYEDAIASAAFSTSTSVLGDLCGRGFRQVQRWKPTLNAFAITFEGRIVPSTPN